MPAFMQDFRFALRLFRRHPAVTALALLSLTLGIGANAGIFSVVQALGFRPLPVSDEASLVRVSAIEPGNRQARLSYTEFDAIRRQAHSFAGALAHGLRGAGVTAPSGELELVMADVVSGDYFATLGVQPALGRPLAMRDEQPGAAPTVVLGHRLWQRSFNADPGIVGRRIRISDTVCEVAGVMPPDFRGTMGLVSPDVWISFGSWSQLGRGNGRDFTDPNSRWLDVTARLKPGVRLDRATEDLRAVAARLAQDFPATNRSRGFAAMPETEARQGNMGRLAVLLFGIVGLVLLIACGNVAGLLLGRAEDRRHEIGVRLAVGASRGRLVRQLLVESTMLALTSGLLACLLAWWLVRLLPALIPPGLMNLGIVFEVDRRMLAFTALLALASGPVFGLLPAWRASRLAVIHSLRRDDGTKGRRVVGLRDLLVAGQVALCVVLLVTSGLLLRSFVRAAQIDPGFAMRSGVVVQFPAPAQRSREEAVGFYRTLVERAASLPGARAATITRRLHLGGTGGGAVQQVVVPGDPATSEQNPLKVHFTVVDDRYFGTVQSRVVAGRPFAASDVTGPQLVMVSEAMARRFWPNGDAVGQRIRVGDPPEPRREYEVVGVVEDGRYNSLTAPPEPFLYFLWGQRFSGDVTLVVRAEGDERALGGEVRRLLGELAPGTPTLRVMTVREHLRMALSDVRLVTILVAVLGGVGLFLAMTGLYGVVSYLVSQRAREIGIRLALGATAGRVQRDVMGRALLLVGGGLLVGGAGSVFLGRTLGSLLYGVSSLDPATHAAVALLVATVAAFASLVPARRAARLDPVRTLRAE